MEAEGREREYALALTLKTEEETMSQNMCPLRAGKGKETGSPLELLRGTSPADTSESSEIDFTLLTSKTVK